MSKSIRAVPSNTVMGDIPGRSLNTEQIGFIGLGKIGLPICKNLIERGVSVFGYKRGSLSQFEDIGGIAASSPADVAQQAQTIFSCLPNESALDDVMGGPFGLVESAQPGQIFVEFGSHATPVKQRYAQLFAEKGAVLLDGEVSGTPGMVEQRKAYIYLAGDAEAATKVEPIIRKISDLYIFLGGFGAATRVKLVNNMLVALNIAGTAQAMAVGLQFDIDPNKLFEAISKGSGGSTQFNIRAPWMTGRIFTPVQGTAEGLLKHLDGFRELAVEGRVETHLVDCILNIYRSAVSVIGERDVAALVDYFAPRV